MAKGPPPAKPTPAQLEAEYLAGGVTYRDLADWHGISLRTIARWGKAGRWEEKRQQVVDDVATELPERVAAAVLDDATELLTRHHDLWQSIIDRAIELRDETEYVVGGMSGEIVLDEHGNPLKQRIVRTAGHLKDLSATIKAATEGQRLARGIPDPRPAKPGEGGLNGAQPAPSADDGRRALDPVELDQRIAAALDRSRGG